MAINSFGFILIVLLAVLACRMIAPRFIREVAVLVLSLYVLATFMPDPLHIVVLAAFLLGIYLVGTAKARATAAWSAQTSLLVVAVLWLALFLLKDPDLLGAFNPFHAHPVKIVGISYVVFRGITFVLEAAPGTPVNFLTFLNYMLFFPTLLAGPIERYQRFDATTQTPVEWKETSYDALNRVLNGFIKKFVIADNLMELGIFSMISSSNDFSTPVLWLGALLMLALLYLDFVGYCDIVIGTAALMGFKIVENFNAPFKAKNLQEFWGRWHMSLGSVIQDYVFSPLSKVVISKVPRHLQMYGIATIYVLAMVLVAMWHGTTLGFLIFGILQGAVLFVIQIRREFARAAAKGRKGGAKTVSEAGLWAGRLATYAYVSLTMIWWQASFPVAIKTYQRLFGWN